MSNLDFTDIAADEAEKAAQVRTYRRRLINVEAIQWLGWNWHAVCDFAPVPEVVRGEATPSDDHMDLLVQSEEGELTYHLNDWLIKDATGEIIPMTPEQFEKTFETSSEEHDCES